MLDIILSLYFDTELTNKQPHQNNCLLVFVLVIFFFTNNSKEISEIVLQNSCEAEAGLFDEI